MAIKFARVGGGGSVQLFGKGGAKASGFVDLRGVRVKTTRGVKKAIKGALTMAATYWHAFYLPLHFKPVAFRFYPQNAYKPAYGNPKNPEWGATTVVKTKDGRLVLIPTKDVNADRGDLSRIKGRYTTRKSAIQQLKGWTDDPSPWCSVVRRETP